MPTVTRTRRKKSSKTTRRKTSKHTENGAPQYVIPGPDDIEEPPRIFDAYVSLIYGESGIGKTSLFSKFEDSFTLMTEPKRKGIRQRAVHVRYITRDEMNKRSYKEDEGPYIQIKGYIQSAMKDKSIKTICVDNIDEVYNLAMNQICYEKSIDHPNEAQDYGHTWTLVYEEVAGLFNSVKYSDKALVFGSKANWREITLLSGKDHERLEPTCSGSCFKYLKNVTDFGIFFGYENDKRAFTLRGGNDIWTKVGVEDSFMDPEGNPVHTIYAGESAEQAYQTLLEGFNNKHYDVSKIDGEGASRPKRRKKTTTKS